MTTPKEKSIASAHRAAEELKDYFNKIGVGSHPRGVVKVAYRNARRAMATVLKEERTLPAVREVMRGAKSSVRSGLADVFTKSQEYGYGLGNEQLGFHNLDLVTQSLLYGGDYLSSSLDAVESEMNKQETVILGLMLSGFDDEQIVGGEQRVGVMSEAPVIASSAYWTAWVMWASFNQVIETRAAGMEYKKVAAAVIDGRTTDTCNTVDGQIQPLDQPFILRGTPRYADKMMMPPFHAYCRTGVALVLE